jgi:hypothetical protein
MNLNTIFFLPLVGKANKMKRTVYRAEEIFFFDNGSQTTKGKKKPVLSVNKQL